ncbi:MAG: hypothetical protein KTR24_04235 [Saprospiraceae bacterium]|nr:hypothetical protein [Saprospiraceae bacterium]
MKLVQRSFVLMLSFLCLLSCSKEEEAFVLGSEHTQIADQGLPHICTELHAGSARAFGSKNAFWTKSTLRVRFLDGSAYVRGKVRQFATEWSRYANIDFQFVDQEPSDIRISFDQSSGSWSYVGRSNAYIASNRATMNFGWFTNRTSDREFRRTTLHEFGHALGLSHEHQHPEAEINWNREAVYDYYGRTQDWTRSEVDVNIFRRYSLSNSNYSDYDLHSIMHYYIPRTLVQGAWNPTSNSVLSAADKAFIERMYPGNEDDVPDCHCNDSLPALACEDFELQTQERLETTAHWSKWSQEAGQAELQTYSWGKVLKMQYKDYLNPDVVYHPQNIDSGSVHMAWQMYVGEGSTAYFNMQKNQEFGKEFGAQVYFNQDREGRLEINNREIAFAYTQGQWMEIELDIDADRDQVNFSIQGTRIASWPLTWSARTPEGSLRFIGINFYNVDRNSRFWLDDFCLSRKGSGNDGVPALSDFLMDAGQSIKGL